MTTSTKNVVVTGASSGIGRATALRLDRNGFRVFAGVRKTEDAERLKEDAASSLTPIQLDVTDDDSVAEAVASVNEHIGDDGLHGLVNNAGIAVAGPVEALELDDWRRQLDVNFFGVLSVTRAFFPLLRKATGRIVNISSVSGRIGVPYIGPYVAAKHALEAMSDVLRQEIRKWKMRVSIIEPGMVATPMIQQKATENYDAIQAKMSPELMQRYGAVVKAFQDQFTQWQQRGMSPEKVAAKVERALTARRPKVRYIVGWDARMGLFLKWILPHSWCDWFTKKLMGLPQ